MVLSKRKLNMLSRRFKPFTISDIELMNNDYSKQNVIDDCIVKLVHNELEMRVYVKNAREVILIDIKNSNVNQVFDSDILNALGLRGLTGVLTRLNMQRDKYIKNKILNLINSLTKNK